MHAVLFMFMLGGTLVASFVTMSLLQWRETELRYRYGNVRVEETRTSMK